MSPSHQPENGSSRVPSSNLSGAERRQATAKSSKMSRPVYAALPAAALSATVAAVLLA